MSATGLEKIYNFHRFSEKLATSGQPREDEFDLIKKSGFEVVINLALPTSTHALPNEAEIVERCGLKYIHIPVVWEKPTRNDLLQFFRTMEENKGKPVFVHCAMNMRVSAFIYLYRILKLGVSPSDAQKDLHKIWVPNEGWDEFINENLAANNR